MTTATEMGELMAAYAATMPPQQRIPRSEWERHSERVIRETIVECEGHERAYLLRVLLVKSPWFPDELDFKTTWYRELDRQLDRQLDPDSARRIDHEELSGSAPAAGLVHDDQHRHTEETPATGAKPLSKPIKRIYGRDEWHAIARGTLTEVLAAHPLWKRPSESIGAGETNYKLMAMFVELRGRVPYWDPESDPPEDYEHSPEQWRIENQEFQQVWFAECAQQFGFQTPVHAAPAPVAPVKPKARQLTLF